MKPMTHMTRSAWLFCAKSGFPFLNCRSCSMQTPWCSNREQAAALGAALNIWKQQTVLPGGWLLLPLDVRGAAIILPWNNYWPFYSNDSGADSNCVYLQAIPHRYLFAQFAWGGQCTIAHRCNVPSCWRRPGERFASHTGTYRSF